MVQHVCLSVAESISLLRVLDMFREQRPPSSLIFCVVIIAVAVWLTQSTAAPNLPPYVRIITDTHDIPHILTHATTSSHTGHCQVNYWCFLWLRTTGSTSRRTGTSSSSIGRLIACWCRRRTMMTVAQRGHLWLPRSPGRQHACEGRCPCIRCITRRNRKHRVHRGHRVGRLSQHKSSKVACKP